jgi:hypothetical protein
MAAPASCRVALKSRMAVGLVSRMPCGCLSPSDGRAMVSCWDGRIYLLEGGNKLAAKLEAGDPARLAWSNDGASPLRALRTDVSCAWSSRKWLGQGYSRNGPAAVDAAAC